MSTVQVRTLHVCAVLAVAGFVLVPQAVGAQATGSAVDPDACFHDPYPREAPNVRVSCDDPSCNVGPCTNAEPAAAAGAPPSQSSTHNPEWTNLNDSDPGVAATNSGATGVRTEPTDPAETGSKEKAGVEDSNSDAGDPEATQRNESDLHFLRTRASEETPNIFTRIWHFLTGWLR